MSNPSYCKHITLHPMLFLGVVFKRPNPFQEIAFSDRTSLQVTIAVWVHLGLARVAAGLTDDVYRTKLSSC
ncbi:hypothetical protein GEOBRER4_n1328 [Citrifermentans bremense]|uniref:Uncharacterized protein n=1 Tax=Citrifermentans bremense TaxID=60035 RepID=A0A6S6LZ01_9BACT|nr:hypothetical protein GEOBRER4_n1328 [Citrifermentans bremense]